MPEKPLPIGQRTIEVRLRFWTNNIAKKEGHVVPKHCWDSGMAILVVNEGHGISSHYRAFYSMADIGRAVEKLLRREGISVHHGRATKDLYTR